jgi:translation elongation factor EF-1alpha
MSDTEKREMDLLRFATAGSVDDGKSTLIGRLLLDSKAIFEDQLEAVESSSAAKGYDYTDLALLTDGLRSEREQGITTSRRRAASSSSPTPRATCSTPGTWSPAPRPPISAWCSSTPGRA